MSNSPINLENIAAPSCLFEHAVPLAVHKPQTVLVNQSLALRFDIDPNWLGSEEGARFLSGNVIVPGTTPMAWVYAGHQFGHFSPRLGDGRAHLLGQVRDAENTAYEIQLKGSGPTAFSRGGDGRSPLGPALREYIISEAMAALGVPTTRSLGVVTTGELVRRRRNEPGGIVARLARCHVRVGTFEYFAATGNREGLKKVFAFSLLRLGVDSTGDLERDTLEFYRRALEGQAKLVAQWMHIGFIHGVMNTDNMLVSGETIDYGPCAFMDRFSSQKVFSSIDRNARYAFNNQHRMAHWNLARLGEALCFLLENKPEFIEQITATLESFQDTFHSHYVTGLCEKFGVRGTDVEQLEIISRFFELLEEASVDFTNAFRVLPVYLRAEPGLDRSRLPVGCEPLPDLFRPWLERWRKQVQMNARDTKEVGEAMDRVNPAVIPRNHLVEAALRSAEAGDFDAIHRLYDVVRRPFDAHEERFHQPPADEEIVQQTFCGT